MELLLYGSALICGLLPWVDVFFRRSQLQGVDLVAAYKLEMLVIVCPDHYRPKDWGVLMDVCCSDIVRLPDLWAAELPGCRITQGLEGLVRNGA